MQDQKNYMSKQAPLVVSARMVAYAILGTRLAIENASTTGEANGHRYAQREYQNLLMTFVDDVMDGSDENL